jgi:hypothetical protein
VRRQSMRCIANCLQFSLVAFGLVTIVACHRDVTMPEVPLSLDIQAHVVDGAPLPVWIEERPGAGAHLTSYILQMTPDGLWKAEGYRYPGNATLADTSFFRDNGVYSFDGKSLVLHSNSQHTDWLGVALGDTVTVTGTLAIANAPHRIVFWP